MRIAICDDEQVLSEQVKMQLEKEYHSLDLIIDLYDDGNQLIKRCEAISYDLVILDIEMPKISGMDTARKLRKKQCTAAIVFLTSHLEYALEGYEVNALRYLTKPADIKKLVEVINFLQEEKKNARKLIVPNGDEMMFLSVKEIYYLEAKNQDIRLVTKQGEYKRRYNLKDYEQELMEYHFFRIHRSYLVNLGFIHKIVGHDVYMENGDMLPISRMKEKGLKEALYRYIQEEAL